MTPCTLAHQAPLPTEFSRQEYWSGLPFSSPVDLPDPGIELWSPALQADSLLSEPLGMVKYFFFFFYGGITKHVGSLYPGGKALLTIRSPGKSTFLNCMSASVINKSIFILNIHCILQTLFSFMLSTCVC